MSSTAVQYSRYVVMKSLSPEDKIYKHFNHLKTVAILLVWKQITFLFVLFDS